MRKWAPQIAREPPTLQSVPVAALSELLRALQTEIAKIRVTYIDKKEHVVMMRCSHRPKNFGTRGFPPLIVSIRNQSWLMKVDYRDGAGTGEVLWRLGY